jgi:hypothetical protein
MATENKEEDYEIITRFGFFTVTKKIHLTCCKGNDYSAVSNCLFVSPYISFAELQYSFLHAEKHNVFITNICSHVWIFRVHVTETMLKRFRLWLYILITTVFHKFNTDFQNARGRVTGDRNSLIFIHDYENSKCILCKAVSINALSIIIESLMLYCRLLAVLIIHISIPNLSTSVFVDFQENSCGGIYENNAIIEYRNAVLNFLF